MKRFLLPFLLCGPACATVDLHFDAPPRPVWLGDSTTRFSESVIRAVGTAPATVYFQDDLALAVSDAKLRLAKLFQSSVKGRELDVSTEFGEKSFTILQQSVELTTHVKVEEVRVERSYRDEETRTQYVEITADREAWLLRVRRRLESEIKKIEEATLTTLRELELHRPLKAYRVLESGAKAHQEAQEDLMVAGLLDPRTDVHERFAFLRQLIGELEKKVQSHSIEVTIEGADAGVSSKLESAITSAFSARGFQIQNGRGGIRIRARFAPHFIRKERVADRDEFLYAAAAELQVLEPSGEAFPEWSIRFRDDRYASRHSDESRAQTEALHLASDALVAKLRNLLRR